MRVFVYLPVVQQLSRLYASPDTAEWLRWAGEHKATNIVKDITESAGWKKYAVDTGFFDDLRNIFMGLCVDGVNPFGKSTHSTWPIMLTIFNFPPHLRTRSELMILIGIIPGPRTPKNINIYLSLFVHELLAYGHNGVWVRDAFKQEDFLLRFFVLQFIADYPGASKVLCLKGANALNGCHVCTVKGHKMGKQATQYGDYRRWLNSDHAWRLDVDIFENKELRPPARCKTDSEIRILAIAAQQASDLFGIKPDSTNDPSGTTSVTGFCALLLLETFEPMSMHCVEPMHILVSLVPHCVRHSLCCRREVSGTFLECSRASVLLPANPR